MVQWTPYHACVPWSDSQGYHDPQLPTAVMEMFFIVLFGLLIFCRRVSMIQHPPSH
ncbi:hypothetical protein BDZ94DRAFT_1258580 [Collybia nuda]|uniref:Uncharacterized protein n=1 Tax=Collybia nuda TaxID=64659 RepID=A0A9P5Y7H9_9AGAR|nr:hypothetical protein BDZ94DRAFT_1258580 [Collybia nuda]